MSNEGKQKLKEYKKFFRKAKKINVKNFVFFFFAMCKNGRKNLDFQ